MKKNPFNSDPIAPSFSRLQVRINDKAKRFAGRPEHTASMTGSNTGSTKDEVRSTNDNFTDEKEHFIEKQDPKR
jgi:hypothetical protein